MKKNIGDTATIFFYFRNIYEYNKILFIKQSLKNKFKLKDKYRKYFLLLIIKK